MNRRGGRLVCRFLNHHKWVRVQTPSEEAYQCRRGGKLHYGKLGEQSDTPVLGGLPPPGGGGGGV